MLAKAGVEVEVLEAAERPGGGTLSGDLTGNGLIHDECSGFHPLALNTPFSREFDLGEYGLQWRWPEVQYAHPLDGGAGGAVVRSVLETAAALGDDERAWNRTFGPLSKRFPRITRDFLKPMMRVPDHPFALARFGWLAGLPASVLVRRLSTPDARALFGGVVAHALRAFGTLASSAIGVALGTAAHTYGWPVAAGGSMAISQAMILAIEKLGGRVTTGVRVRGLRDVGDADIVMFDLAPRAAAAIAGDALPARVANALARYRHGPGVFKVDFAIHGDVPWTHTSSRRAGTVHLGGTFEEVAANERATARGQMPTRPFVLVGQQYLADPSRSSGSLNPLYAYAHVPAGYTGDASHLIEEQIERFAPGFKERIVARSVTTTTDVAVKNPNYVGGDVVTGLNSARQLLFRPRVALDPYQLGAKGLYLCSAATPPGAGAHGMCGYNAARSALRRL